MNPTIIHISPSLFSEKEKPLVQFGLLKATAFKFDSGVCAVRLSNERGEMVVLPFQGQQIWSATMDGRPLTMHSMFEQPQATRNYLETYGGFLIHCGFTAMGVPTKEDSHPLHGELPNAPYSNAYIETGVDGKGPFIGIGGQYRHTVAFSYNYLAEPVARLYSQSTLITSEMTITNLKKSPMEYMYLAHANFRPVDHSRLVYSALSTPEHVRVRSSIPSHVHPLPGYKEFLDSLQEKPEIHHVLKPGLMFDPEVVFFIDYLSDAEGWSHTLQVHPDGAGDYLRHKTSELPIGVRWICRTADQDALGMILPATAEPEGYHAELAKGNIKTLPAGGKFHFTIELGSMTKNETSGTEEKINGLIKTAVKG
jgi:hypothetical protein